jgi:acylphosphatase
MNQKSVSITLKGRVQGVGFRYHTMNMATKYGIQGRVRNLPDGSVYIEAQAPEKNLDLFLDWCRKGPALARVSDIKINTIPQFDATSFTIR